MTTVPQNSFTEVFAPLRADLTVDNGIPGGGANDVDQLIVTIEAYDGWQGDTVTTQYVQDLLEEAMTAIAAKLAADYPLATPYSPSYTVVKRQGY